MTSELDRFVEDVEPVLRRALAGCMPDVEPPALGGSVATVGRAGPADDTRDSRPMSSLAETAPAFVELAHRIVWCTVATVEPDGRPRTRILHPIWEWDGERLRGWIATGRTPIKAAGLEQTPHVSLTYWDDSHDTATADCRAEWIDPADKQAVWDRFATAPPPVGYDPAIIPPWADGPTSPAFDGLILDPYRLRVMPGTLMTAGQGELLTWRE